MTYQAGAIGPGIPQGRCAGTLMVAPDRVVFASEAGQFEFPLEGLQLSRGGASQRLIFLRHAASEGLTVHTADPAMLIDPVLRELPQVEALRISARGRRRRTAALVALGLALPVGAVFVVIALWGQVTALLAAQIPVSIERQLGSAALESYADGLLCEGPVAAALDAMIAPLTARIEDGRYDYTLCLSGDPGVNAFALPGGILVVQRGLIDAVGGDAELLGVLAHEIAHVNAQHGVRSMINALGWLTALQLMFGDVSGIAGVLVQAAPFLIQLQYSQGFEREADALAVELLAKAGIDPHGLIRFFDQLKTAEQEDDVQIPQFLSTHPATDDRIATLRELIDAQDIRFAGADRDDHLTTLRNAMDRQLDDGRR